MMVGSILLYLGFWVILDGTIEKWGAMDFRYVYLIRTSRRKIIKIGITNDIGKRAKNIDRSIKGSRERVAFCVQTFFARSIESMFHRRYKSKRTKWKGSGKTEWFKLGFLERASVISLLLVCWLLSESIIHLVTIIILILCLK